MNPFVGSQPNYLVFFVTSRCNAKCSFCLNKDNFFEAQKKNELSLSEINRFLDNTNKLEILSITGGEPFLRDDIGEIGLAFIKKAQTKYIGLHTNGMYPEKLEKSLLLMLPEKVEITVCISIDGREEDHNSIRGLKHGMASIRECMGRLKKLQEKYSNLTIVTSTIFEKRTKDNMADIHNYIKKEFDVQNNIILVRPENNEPHDFNLDTYKDFYNNHYEHHNIPRSIGLKWAKHTLDSLLPKTIYELASSGKRRMNCVAGRYICVLYEQGDLFPCEHLGQKFGNIRDVQYNWYDLLKNEQAKKILQHIKDRKCCCTWDNIIPFNIANSPGKYASFLTKATKMKDLEKCVTIE